MLRAILIGIAAALTLGVSYGIGCDIARWRRVRRERAAVLALEGRKTQRDEHARRNVQEIASLRDWFRTWTLSADGRERVTCEEAAITLEILDRLVWEASFLAPCADEPKVRA